MGFRSQMPYSVRPLFSENLPEGLCVTKISPNESMMVVAESVPQRIQVSSVGQLINVDYSVLSLLKNLPHES
jgi:hypothetical protein